MSARFGITVDCHDPVGLAQFWRDVLGYVDDPVPDGYPSWVAYDEEHGVDADAAAAGATILDPDDRRPRIYFQRVPEPATSKNRWHLDVVGSPARDWAGVEATVDRAVTLGATVLRSSADPDDRFVVLADPEGNQFCVVM